MPNIRATSNLEGGDKHGVVVFLSDIVLRRIRTSSDLCGARRLGTLQRKGVEQV